MPNLLGDKNQDEAEFAMRQFRGVIESGCSELLKRYICALFVPECSMRRPEALRPCRELCVAARRGECEPVMEMFNLMPHKWPWYTRCDSLPVAKDGDACYMGKNGIALCGCFACL